MALVETQLTNQPTVSVGYDYSAGSMRFEEDDILTRTEHGSIVVKAFDASAGTETTVFEVNDSGEITASSITLTDANTGDGEGDLIVRDASTDDLITLDGTNAIARYEGNGAFSFGERTGVSTGDQSFALGYAVKPVGFRSLALGFGNISSAAYSFSAGRGNQARAEHAVAIGRGTEARANNATSMGLFTNANGEASTALGNATTASANTSTALGNATNASGTAATATGFSTLADGDNSFAMGNSTTADGVSSVVTGEDTVSRMYGGVVHGLYNEDYLGGGGGPALISGVAASDRMFAVGIGDDPSAAPGDNRYSDGLGTADGLYVTYRNGTHVRGGLTVERFETDVGGNYVATGGVTNVETVLSIGNEIASGSDSSQVLVRNPSTNELEYVDGSSLGGAVAAPGNDTELVFNDGGSLGADPGLTFGGTVLTAPAMRTGGSALGEGSVAISSDTAAQYSSSVLDPGTAGFVTEALGDASLAQGHGTVAEGEGSVAMGLSANAKGHYSLAQGLATQAEGLYAVTTGSRTRAVGQASFAAGRGSEALGNNSLAGGSESEAAAVNSFAFGQQAKATGEFSVAFGERTESTGRGSIAGGNYANIPNFYTNFPPLEGPTRASGNRSFAWGIGTVASGRDSFAFGPFTEASGEASVAMGYQTLASDQRSFALGDVTEARGRNCIAMGEGTVASGRSSAAMGSDTVAAGQYSIAAGFSAAAENNAEFALATDSVDDTRTQKSVCPLRFEETTSTNEYQSTLVNQLARVLVLDFVIESTPGTADTVGNVRYISAGGVIATSLDVEKSGQLASTNPIEVNANSSTGNTVITIRTTEDVNVFGVAEYITIDDV